MAGPPAVFLLLLAASSCLVALGGVVPYVIEGGPGYNWILSEQQRDNGMAYYPAAERLRVKLDKLRRGEKLKLTTVGGSIMSGQGQGTSPSLPQYIFNWFNTTHPNQVTWHSGAMGGTMSSYMSVCHNIHIPKDSEIIIVEYSVNDWYHPPGLLMQNDMRRGFERLLRKLLNYPLKPAVLLVHSYIWFQRHPEAGSFWSNSERDFSEFERFYYLPAVSVKAAVYHKLAENKEDGYIRDTFQLRNPELLTGKVFYFDELHPSGATGARMTAELIFHMVNRTFAGLETKPLTAVEVAAANATLPPPMIPHNYESLNDKCFIGIAFTSVVHKKEGFEWINESKNNRPKWGMVGTVVGSVLQLKVDTTATKTEKKSLEVLIQLAFLRSYEGMGEGVVTCISGCTCPESRYQGHQTIKQSQLNLHNFYVTESKECVIAITVAASTRSEGTKVKVSGVIISEEAGTEEGIRNEMAVEYAQDISARGDGVFENRNHAKKKKL